MRFIIKIGDHRDFFVYESNKTLDEITNAYMISCETTKVCFDDTHNRKYIKLAIDFDDNSIPKVAEKNLLEFGLDVWDGYDPAYYDIDECLSHFDGVDHFMEIFWKFVKISLPDLILEEGFFKKSEMTTMPCFRFDIGYGLFSYR